jgi:hypothetical protein
MSLASPKSSSVSGVTLSVDGGLLRTVHASGASRKAAVSAWWRRYSCGAAIDQRGARITLECVSDWTLGASLATRLDHGGRLSQVTIEMWTLELADLWRCDDGCG